MRASLSRINEQDQLTQNQSKAQTNHVERFNCTLRQRLGRLVRETFSFSKSDLMHHATLAYFIHRYNIANPPHEPLPFYAALQGQQVPSQLLELPSGDHGLDGYKGPM